MTFDHSSKSEQNESEFEAFTPDDSDEEGSSGLYNPHEALRQVSDHVRGLRKELKQVKREAVLELTEIKAEAARLLERSSRAEQEVDRLRDQKADVEQRLETINAQFESEKIKNSDLKLEITRLERDLDEARRQTLIIEEKYAKLVDKATKSSEEVDKLTTVIAELDKRTEARESELETERSKVLQISKDIRRLKSELSSADDKVKLLEKRHDDAVKMAEKDKARLVERIASESVHEVNVFQKRIENALKYYYREVEKINFAPMSKEIGEDYRIQVKGMFDKLRELGIDLRNIS